MFEEAVRHRKPEGDTHGAQYEIVIALLWRFLVYRGVPAPARVGAEFFDDYGA